MKLNPDCVRDILLTVEENSRYGSTLQYGIFENYPKLLKYSNEEFVYHTNQCKLCGFFTSCKISPQGDLIMISDLTPQGHEFIANIRSSSAWSNIKSAAKKVGMFSLKSISQIAINYASSVVSSLDFSDLT